jgi:hypothetical protein
MISQEVLLDMCEIGPYEKWVKYGFFPTKFLFHVLLVIMTTWIVINNNSRCAAIMTSVGMFALTSSLGV